MFLQPRVLFDWTGVQNALWVSLVLRTGSVDKMVEAAMRASHQSILVHLKPGVEFEDRCHILAWMPSDQLLSVLRVVQEYHRDRAPPIVAVQDKQATIDLFRPTFCKLDWRLFDPREVAWRFEGDRYLERVKAIKA